MLKPAVLQVILHAALKLLWGIVGNQDRNKRVQGIKSFLEGRKDKDSHPQVTNQQRSNLFKHFEGTCFASALFFMQAA